MENIKEHISSVIKWINPYYYPAVKTPWMGQWVVLQGLALRAPAPPGLQPRSRPLCAGCLRAGASERGTGGGRGEVGQD